MYKLAVPHALRSNRLHGFTLVELMVVVVIIGVLAGTAIPAFTRVRTRARAAEMPAVITAIALLQESYRLEFGQYATEPGGTNGMSAWYPAGTPDSTPSPWVDDAVGNPFGILGAAPRGQVYGHYRMSAGFGGAPAVQYPDGWDAWWYVIEAQYDLDENGVVGSAEGIAGRAEIWRNINL